MFDPSDVLAERFKNALSSAFGVDFALLDPGLRSSQFADFQANVSLALAKHLGSTPKVVASRLVEHLNVEDVCLPPVISGPGFINLTLRNDWMAHWTNELSADVRLGVPLQNETIIVIDYSAPNVAKEMHVGHLRTTIVGDALARILEYLGHRVVRQNHLGDWGTPFGMLIEHLLDAGEHSIEARRLLDRPNDFYQAARLKFDSSESFANRSRQRVVALQAGDPATLRLWHELIDLSTSYFNSIYRKLNVTLTNIDLAGESTYNKYLSDICSELELREIARISEGALCIFLDGFTGRGVSPIPLIIRKMDGGYGYATTDLAAIKHRVQDLHADRILYVVGAPQQLHLRMVFETARKAGWLPSDVEAVHVQIGNVLGIDGKILRTRSGAPVHLMNLLDEAIERAAAVLANSRPDLDGLTRSEIAEVVGIGAVKYADLSVSHNTAYTFDLDRMVALTGNTGPYLQYATTRIKSILRKAHWDVQAARISAPIVIAEDAERALSIALLNFGCVIERVGYNYELHQLCSYLFDLAQRFTTFYELCPILAAKDPVVRDSRLSLSALALRALELGLGMLGISTPAQM